jgi:hypothetical protein
LKILIIPLFSDLDLVVYLAISEEGEVETFPTRHGYLTIDTKEGYDPKID